MKRNSGFGRAWAVAALLSAAGALLLLPLSGAAGSKRNAAEVKGDQPWSSCEDGEGYVVQKAPEYVVNSAKCSGRYEAWLSKAAAGAAAGASGVQREIVDHLSVRDLKADEMFSSGPYCYLRGQAVEWVAIYRVTKGKRIPRNGGVREAWVVDPAVGKFAKAPATLLKSVRCEADEGE